MKVRDQTAEACATDGEGANAPFSFEYEQLSVGQWDKDFLHNHTIENIIIEVQANAIIHRILSSVLYDGIG